MKLKYSESELRRRMRRLHAALNGVRDHTAASAIQKAIAGLERDLVQLLGSEKAFAIVEEIRTATTDDSPPVTAPASEKLLALRTAITVKQDEFGAAIAGPADLAETRRINDNLAAMIRHAHEMELAERAEAIVNDLKSRKLIARNPTANTPSQAAGSTPTPC
jgi:hypothetical protein